MKNEKKEKILIDLKRVEGSLLAVINHLNHSLKDIRDAHTEIFVRWDHKVKKEKQ